MRVGGRQHESISLGITEPFLSMTVVLMHMELEFYSFLMIFNAYLDIWAVEA